jgi:hypothetical protein
VLKRFYPLTPEAAITVASDLTYDDQREVAHGHGIDNVMDIVIKALSDPSNVYLETPQGRIAAMGGATDGRIWMLSTPFCTDYPLTFARDIKRYVDSRPDKMLWNIVDKRNTTHIKLLRYLGFKFLRQVPYGPYNLPFLEFCKIQCVSQETKVDQATTQLTPQMMPTSNSD